MVKEKGSSVEEPFLYPHVTEGKACIDVLSATSDQKY